MSRMKRLMILNWNGVIPDLRSEFEVVRYYGDGVLVWTDVVGESERAVKLARERGLPSFVMQHGIYLKGNTEYEEHGKKPLADYVFCWNELSKGLYLKAGYKEDQIINVGCSLMRFPVKRKDEGLVVFAPAHLETSRELNDLNKDESFGIIEELRLEKIKFVVKGLVGETETVEGVEYLMTNRKYGEDHLRMSFDLLSKASVVIVQDESTFSTLAVSLDIPIIKMKNGYPKRTEASTECGLIDLTSTIEDYLKDPTIKQVERHELALTHTPPFNFQLMIDTMTKAMNKVQREYYCPV